MTKIFWST